MVNYSGGAAALDATFGALADPTRRAILARLARSPESSVGELARPFAMSLPAISKHLRVLEEAGLLGRRKQGRIHRCHIVPAPMQTAAAWIARYRDFWEARLDALEDFLAATAEEEKPWSARRVSRSRTRGSASRGSSRPRARGSTGPGRSRSS